MKNFDLEITKGLVRLLLFNKDITKNTSLSLSSLFKRQLFNLGSILFLVLGMGGVLMAQTATFNADGTFVVPAGVTSITVQAFGGGGGGGGNFTSRPGGGGGAFASSVISVTPGTSYSITVGAGGAAGTSGNDGVNGGNSIFGANLVVAAGGGGGTSVAGTAGLASASIGTTTRSGGAGGVQTNNNDGSGGGGGAANASNAGGTGGSTNSDNSGGAGGTSVSGTGTGGAGAGRRGTASNGNAPGGGGGGRPSQGTGGSGADGRVIVTWTCSNVSFSNFSTSVATPICVGAAATVTINSTSINLATGTYTVYYTLSAPNAATANSATLTWNNTTNVGTFSTTALANAGSTTITINSIDCGVPTANNTATVTTTASPTLTLGTFPTVCSGVASANLPYSATTGTPNAYTINYDAAAEAAGFADILSFTNFDFGSNTSLGLTIPTGVNAVPGNAYNGTLTVRNNTTLCTSTYAFTVTIAPLPTITLDASPVICRGITSANLGYSAVSGSPTKYSIAYSGPVVLSSDVALTNLPASPIVLSVPSNAVPGTYNATITVQNANLCNSAATGFTVEILDAAIANAGVDQTKCYSTPNVTLAGSISGTATSGTWTTNGGDGTFIPDNNFATATTYIPGPTDISNGTVTLILTTNDPGGICPGAGVDQMIVTIAPAPTVNAGSNLIICANTFATLEGSFGGSATGISWSSPTSGVFSNTNNTTPTARYTPSAADISNGSVTLTISSTGSVCPVVTDQMILTVNPIPTVTLGTLPSSCVGTTGMLPFSNPVNGADQYSINFNGANNFTNVGATSLSGADIPIVIPATTTATTFSATLTIINSITGCSSTQNFSVTVLKTPNQPGNITASQTTVCPNVANLVYSIAAVAGATSYIWSVPNGWNITGGGTGNSITVTSGSAGGNISVVAVNACGQSTARTLAINIVNSNDIGFSNVNTNTLSICATTTNPNILITGGNPSGGQTFTWLLSTTGPNGTFIVVDNTDQEEYDVPNTYYNNAGVYYFRRDITDNSSCNSSSDIVTLTVNAIPTITGVTNPATICPGTTTANLTYTATTGSPTLYSLNYSNAANTAGFVDLVDAVLPSSPIVLTIPAGIGAGTYTATLTVKNATTTCSSTSSNVTITVGGVNAGVDQTICTTAASATLAATGTGTWTTSGTGAFSNANSATSTYTPSPADKGAGTVTLTYTASAGNACPGASDQMVLTISALNTANAGVNQTVCTGNGGVQLNGSIGGGATTFAWSRSGGGGGGGSPS